MNLYVMNKIASFYSFVSHNFLSKHVLLPRDCFTMVWPWNGSSTRFTCLMFPIFSQLETLFWVDFSVHWIDKTLKSQSINGSGITNLSFKRKVYQITIILNKQRCKEQEGSILSKPHIFKFYSLNQSMTVNNEVSSFD